MIGVIAAAAFWMYIFLAGRAATRAGATGDTEGDFATDTVALAG